MKNIRTFLKVCHDKFGLRNSELFDPFDLFDVRDFGKVSGLLDTRLHWVMWAAQAGWLPTPCLLSRVTDGKVLKPGLCDRVEQEGGSSLS